MGHQRALTSESKKRAPEILGWVARVTGKNIGKSANTMHDDLKDGHVLGALANKIKPGSVKKLNSSKLAFMQMENVTAFINFARKVGISEADNFSTIDLYEGKDLNQVLQCLASLARLCHKIPSFHGPYLSGQKESDANLRDPKSFNKKFSGMSLMESKQMEIQKKLGASTVKPRLTGYDKPKPKSGGMSLFERKQMEIQKKSKPNVVKPRLTGYDKPKAKSGGIGLMERKQMEIQKKSKPNVVKPRLTGYDKPKSSSPGSIGLMERKQMELQKKSKPNVVKPRLTGYDKPSAFKSSPKPAPKKASPTPNMGGGDAADQILKFAKLRDAGIITNAEFNAKKKQLLGL